MRLAAVAHSPWLGGAERCLLELVEALPAVERLVVLPSDGPMRPRLEAAGAAVRVVPSRWWASDPGARRRGLDWGGVRRVGAALRAWRPDMVLSNTMVQPAGAVAARVLGLPHLWWVHELGGRDHGFRFPLGQRGTVRAIGALSDRVLVSAPVVRDALLADGLHAAKLREVPYAIPVAPATAAAAPRPPRLVITGRVRESKGQADAVAALAQLPEEVQLDVVGDGELDGLARLARRLGVRERVHLHGGLPDPTPVLDAATIALMCSRDEAFGRVTVEAMKRGKPVVGAAAGGTAHLIEDGVTGRLYPPGDPAALAAVVGELLSEGKHRERLAAAGQAFAAAAFRPERTAEAFLAAVGDALAGPNVHPLPSGPDRMDVRR